MVRMSAPGRPSHGPGPRVARWLNQPQQARCVLEACMSLEQRRRHCDAATVTESWEAVTAL
eukprot:CAMPEP_0202859846 /NCGR_PEP_ID=MMETSP1391-20130828/1797_1 /ASSEMBLY_ACC=CAM_ASM_000867 /TAXON_ID=1034604 /ORGANISM="Chlamydomonas leiostraca, Strain SAG 11-49" /LENGTH=60 /DNA_ID=CAMNT_0049538941 /DNA_START=328 /DNA_END=510 /DNA_ORIENTATION=-